MDSEPVHAAQETSLAQRLAALGVRDADLRETFVASGGHGGQNVNKVATCVMLVHIPTGIQVKCQDTRYQGRNREIARRLLAEKLEARERDRAAADRDRVEKARRQKRAPSRAAKKRNLANKAHRAAVKGARRPPSSD